MYISSLSYLSSILSLHREQWYTAEEEEQTQDYNERFQRAMSDVRALNPNTRHRERVRCFRTLARLSQDFTYAVKTYGRIIVSEMALPVHQKTVSYMPMWSAPCVCVCVCMRAVYVLLYR
jgi:Clustered mitochondria